MKWDDQLQAKLRRIGEDEEANCFELLETWHHFKRRHSMILKWTWLVLCGGPSMLGSDIENNMWKLYGFTHMSQCSPNKVVFSSVESQSWSPTCVCNVWPSLSQCSLYFCKERSWNLDQFFFQLSVDNLFSFVPKTLEVYFLVCL